MTNEDLNAPPSQREAVADIIYGVEDGN